MRGTSERSLPTRSLGTLLLAGGLLASACEGGDPVPPGTRDAGPPPPTPVMVENIAAYEGQGAFVTVLVSSGDDWTDATVSGDGALELLAQRCDAERCAVIASVRDLAPNSGQTIPAPFDATRSYLTVTAPSGVSRGLVQVFPTDALSVPAASRTSADGVYFAASVTAGSASVLAGRGEPVRWVVFGDARIDRFDVSALEAAPGPGGGAGGAELGRDAPGPGGGLGASAERGAGGGASAEAGGVGVPAGEPAEPIDPSCALDFFAPRCGGGGGGGGAGAGGDGAGSLAVVVLGNLCLGEIVGRGGSAPAGSRGGGGGGGLASVTASALDCEPSADLRGGDGDDSGGRGGDGRLLLGGRDFPRIIFDSAALIAVDPAFVVRGAARPGSRITVERLSVAGPDSIGEGEVGDDGSFAVEVPLVPGLNRLRVVQLASDGAPPVRAWNGNHVELERREDAPTMLPVGGLLDVAWIP